MPAKRASKQSPAKSSTPKVVSAKKVSTTNSKRSSQTRRSVKANTAEAKKSVASSVSSAPVNETLKTNLRNPRLWIGIVVVVVAIVLYAARGLFIAALVNGQPISRLEVVQQLEKQSGKDVLNSLITQMLILQEAQNQHVSVSQSEINASESQIETALKNQGTNLNDALAARGMTKQELDNQIKIQKLVEKMVGKNVKVTDKQVEDYINANKDNLPQNVSDDQLKKQVQQQLQQQQLATLTQQFIDNLQKKASIQTFVNY